MGIVMEISVIMQTALLVFLGAAALIDVREKQIPVLFIAAGFAAGIILQLVYGNLRVLEIAGGCLIGAVALLAGFLTKQQIGYGDGLMLVTTGVFLGVLGNAVLLLFSLLITAVTGIVLLRMKKISKRFRIPYIPFLLAGYVVLLLL